MYVITGGPALYALHPDPRRNSKIFIRKTDLKAQYEITVPVKENVWVCKKNVQTINRLRKKSEEHHTLQYPQIT